jgi:hypothetical protein
MTDLRSYTNGHGERQGTTASRSGSDFVNTLQDAVRENPISAALIGMGVLWMFMGGSNTSLFGGGGRKSIFRTAGQGVEDISGAVRDTAARVGSSVGHTASQVVGQAADAVGSAYDATSNAASRAAEAISHTTTTAANAMQETGTKWGGTVQQNISDLFERQPLLLGAVGIAIGAGIAASIPTTEAENKVMGEASDMVRETVSEKAGQVKEMAAAALGEAKAQGLTPEGASEALRIIGDKVSAVAEAATSSGSATLPPRGSKKV